MRGILRFFLMVLLLIILGTLGYIYMRSQSVIVPDTPTIEINSSNLVAAEKEKEILEQQLKEKKTALEYQAALLEEKKALLKERKEEIATYIANEAEKIKEKYQVKVNKFQDKLAKEYQDLQEKKEQEYLEKMLVKKQLYEEKLKESVFNVEDSSLQQLEEYKQNLIKEYYIEKINYDLKLKFLDLTEEEKEEYITKLTEIESNIMLSFKEKESNVIKEIRNKIEQLEEKYNQELVKYEKNLKDEIEKDLNEKQAANNQLLDEYLLAQHDLLDLEVRERAKELQERSSGEIVALEAIVKNISQEYLKIQAEVSTLEKEVMY